MHFNNKNLTGKLDNSTYSIILSHFNDFLTKNKYKLISLQRWCDDRLSNQEESPGSTGK